jgi:hypothetical protein
MSQTCWAAAARAKTKSERPLFTLDIKGSAL